MDIGLFYNLHIWKT